MAGRVRGMSRRSGAVRAARLIFFRAAVGTEVVRGIQLVRTVEQHVQPAELDRPLPPRHVRPRAEPLVIPRGLERTCDRNVERGPNERLPRRRPVPQVHEIAERVAVIQPRCLALHRARHSATRANDLLTRQPMHERRADRRRQVQQAADRTTAIVRARDLDLLVRPARVRQPFARLRRDERARIVAVLRQPHELLEFALDLALLPRGEEVGIVRVVCLLQQLFERNDARFRAEAPVTCIGLYLRSGQSIFSHIRLLSLLTDGRTGNSRGYFVSVIRPTS